MRLGVAGTAIALVALAVGAISPAWGSSSNKDKQTTFRVEALTTEQNFEGTALGDQIVFTTQLLQGDTEVGHQGGVSPVTSVARSEAQCIATYSLRGGQITGQALIRLGDPAPYAGAITGGSGK
jgi:type II secretory pathway pseudopilin PulG